MVKPKRIKPHIKNKGSLLIEAEFYRKSVIICIDCYNKRVSKIKINKSVYQADFWHRPRHPYFMHFQLASWEKVVCADCGRKNTNPNLKQYELHNYGRKRKPYPAPYDPFWQEPRPR